MHFHETRAAIAATVTGIVLATGISAAATPASPPPAATTATASQQVDAPLTGFPLHETVDGRDGR